MTIDTDIAILLPAENEVCSELMEILRHSQSVHYFAKMFRLKDLKDPVPHDMEGEGNKLEWSIFRSLALQYRDPKVNPKIHICPYVKIHRKVYHHQIWQDENMQTELNPSYDDLRFSAIDAISAQTEDRPYKGGKHTYEEAEKRLINNPKHKLRWIKEMLPRMRKVPQPRIELITNFDSFPNIGIPDEIYDKMVYKITNFIAFLREDKGYILKP